MKIRGQNIIPVALMWLSLLVLLLFMSFWLKNVYQEQYQWLDARANNLFVQTTRNLQDSLMHQLISEEMEHQEQRGDTAVLSVISHQHHSTTDTNFHSRMRIRSTDQGIFSDTMANRQIKIMLTADVEAAIPDMISSMVLSFSPTDSTTGPLLKIGSDSLKIDTIQHYFQQALLEADIDLPFLLTHLDSNDPSLSYNGISTSITKGGFPPNRYYQAHFSNYYWYLLKKILPQLLFSLFLISLTSVSFLLIYQNLKRQQRLTELKNDFIRNITHELKTPVTTVGVAIEALNNFNALQDPDRTKEYLDISRSELNRLSMLIDKVLRMAIFEKKGLEMKLETFDLKDIVTEILASMRLQFQKQKAKVSFETKGENFVLEADRIHLTSVIYNLVDNALKYSKDNPIIELNLKNSATHLTIAIKDNGVGISPEFREKIFEKFFRVPTGDQHNTKGYGLGLSYVASVIQNHHGEIKVESELGAGSCFLLSLPRKHGQS